MKILLLEYLVASLPLNLFESLSGNLWCKNLFIFLLDISTASLLENFAVLLNENLVASFLEHLVFNCPGSSIPDLGQCSESVSQ